MTLRFVRENAGKAVPCAFNLSDEEQTFDLPTGDWTIDTNAPFTLSQDGAKVTLPAWQAAFAGGDKGNG